MDIKFTNTRLCSVSLFTTFLFIGSLQAQTNIVVKVLPPSSQIPLSKYETFVVSALLQDIGLELDAQKKEKALPDPIKDDAKPLPPPSADILPAPEPEPKPVPEPEPKPVPEPEPKPSPKPEPVPSTDTDRWGFNEMRDNFQKDYSTVLSRWDESYQQVLSQWREARKSYIQDEEKHLEATIDFTLLLDASPMQDLQDSAHQTNVLASKKSGDFHVIPNALNLKIKNQQFRGTCAAFAGVRAIEAILHQDAGLNKYQLDLSEQHFYWMSKPKCMKAPCVSGRDSEGSTFDTGFKISGEVSSPEAALRQEKYCPYEPRVNSTNLTYTPLGKCSASGQFKVDKFNTGLRVDDIISELSKNRPIAAGFTLTKSFFKTKGLVKARDPINAKNALGKHAGGHAVLLVGYIKLPDKYWAEEGKYCAIAANSWGAGYGKGGYACLSETWMKENRIAITKNSIRSILTSVESVVLLHNSKT